MALSEQVIRGIWNDIPSEGRDMKYADFRQEMIDLTDSGKLQEDLTSIMMAKEQMTRIDQAVARGKTRNER